jgi:hypothetical protein
LNTEKPNVEPAPLRLRCPRRIKIALGLVLAAVLLCQAARVVSLAQGLPSAMAKEGMARYEKRFAQVRKVLPRFGVIGYVSDQPNDREVTQALYDRRHHSAAYHLAPLIIVDSLEPDIILGNFFTRQAMEKAVAEHKLVVIRDFENGVFILRKEGS